jgi:hypothetical protein
LFSLLLVSLSYLCESLFKASIVAYTLLALLFVPKTLDEIFSIPAKETTLLTAPPAITPEPVGAGFNRIFAAPNLIRNSKGIEPLIIGISIACFLARDTPFLLLLYRFYYQLP